jgi:hypothetical protein
MPKMPMTNPPSGSAPAPDTADHPACYCRGTLILTDHGEVAVEDLRIGDRLVTRSGAARAIRWIGTRNYVGRLATESGNALPVCIHAGALAEGVPRRDLSVSPLHAMFLDGALVTAQRLVNGTTITQRGTVGWVDYFHVELDSHDIIWAEGAPSETFLDDHCRASFHNAAEYRSLYPDEPTRPAEPCAPRLEGGEALAALKRRLAARICAPG